jgi:CheY-like chemotaxis protein
MMFEALTGQSPFRGSSSMELMLAALQEPPRELRSIRAEVPFGLSSIIAQALAKDAAARPQSGADLLAALQTMDAPRVDAFPGRRLLIVDDDASVRDLLSTIAGRLGVTFDVATNGREAIDAIKARRYTVALLDLNMPRMDGWAVIDFLRRKPADKPSHVFVVTGFADQHMTGVENDVVEKVLYKPINAESLRDVLVRALG